MKAVRDNRVPLPPRMLIYCLDTGVSAEHMSVDGYIRWTQEKLADYRKTLGAEGRPLTTTEHRGFTMFCAGDRLNDGGAA